MREHMPELSKIDDLEMKIAFLEDALEKLSDEFYKQQTKVTLLTGQQSKLIEQVRSLNDTNGSETSISDERPPHY